MMSEIKYYSLINPLRLFLRPRNVYILMRQPVIFVTHSRFFSVHNLLSASRTASH